MLRAGGRLGDGIQRDGIAFFVKGLEEDMVEAVDADAEAYLSFGVPQEEAYIFLLCFTEEQSFQLTVAFGSQALKVSVIGGSIVQTPQ